MELFYIFASITTFGLIAYGLQIWAVRSTLKSKHYTVSGKHHKKTVEESSYSLMPTAYYPPISILKPLKGLDDNLFDNLASFCMQDYPEYEIIFSLQDYNDPAYKVVRKVRDKYPARDISIIVERCDEGLNPKVNNMIPALRASKYEHILISDSNVIVDKYYLKETAKHMADIGVGLVSNLIIGIGGRTIGAVLENLHLNSFVIGGICLLDRYLKMPCVVGKSMLMRKGDLEAIGGFTAVKDLLAEDYIIGKKIHEKGKKVILSNHVIKNVNEYWSIGRFLNRHTRWGKLRWRIGGLRYLSELIGNFVFISFLPLLFWETSRTTISFPLSVSLIKALGDYYMGVLLGNGETASRRGIEIKSSTSRFTVSPLRYVLSPIKDLIVGFLWFVPILSNTVVWRGNRYIIGKDSKLSPYPDNGLLAWRYRLLDAIKARFVWVKS